MDMNKAILDELMGKDRNLSLKEQLKKKDSYTDSKVCKFELVSVCPYSLFPNTRNDLGVCTKRHDTSYKRQFENIVDYPNEKKYIEETLKFFEGLLKNIDDKIIRTQQKLESPKHVAERPAEVQVRLDNYDDEIKRLLSEAEKFGVSNQVEQMENAMQEVEKIKQFKEDLIKISEQSQKSMKVCEVCGALQIINDTEQRQQAHLTGKLHTGFATVRSEFVKLRARLEELEKLDLEKEGQAQKERSKSKSKKKRSKSRRKHSRSHSKRKHRKHHRSRSKKRSKSRSRSHRRHKHRSKDRNHKSKRDRDRKHDKRDKDKDRDRKHDKSRHRDKDKNRDKDKTKDKEKTSENQKEKSEEKNKEIPKENSVMETENQLLSMKLEQITDQETLQQ